ncbi:MAG: HNH endonuclease [Parasporobacterium sp.]|nr:HNH endonuclease [Parasporobacterium sp.]
MGKYTGFDDNWITENWQRFSSWGAMYEEYKVTHKSSYPVSSFRSHCSQDLGLKRRYTPEQDKWLAENYPHMGAEKAHKAFEETFGIKKGLQGFKTHCNDLGLHVTDKRWREACQNNGHHEGMPIGAIRKRSRGVVFTKTEDGWKPLCHTLVGDIPKGHFVVHLDKDTTNNEKENLAVISRKVGARMTVNKFWSDNAELTKTGVLCCELEEALET